MTPASPNPKRRYDTLPTVSKGTDLQSFRLAAPKWRKLAERAEAAGSNRAVVLRQLIDWYNGEPGAELPQRLEAGGTRAQQGACTCPLGPEDAHFPDCPMYATS